MEIKKESLITKTLFSNIILIKNNKSQKNELLI